MARYEGPATDYDRATALAVDGEGKVYVTGESDGERTWEADCATVKQACWRGQSEEAVGAIVWEGGEERIQIRMASSEWDFFNYLVDLDSVAEEGD